MTFRPRHSPRSPALALATLFVAALGTGCITVYQPLVSLQQPTVVDPRLPNFEGLRLLVHCLPGDFLSQSDAQRLCRHVGSLFRNQGADVETEIPRDGRAAPKDENGKRPDLVIALTSRLLHEDSSTLLALLSAVTFSLVPAYSEQTFAQEIEIRDASGFLLARQSVQARLIEYFGAGIWGVNKALDLLVRSDEDELSEASAKRDFSRDYDTSLSQLVLNARVRSVVLQGFEN